MPAPYRSVEEALAFAYGMEARVVCKLACWPDRSGSTGGADPFAPHAEAAMITALVRRVLRGVLLAAVWSQHTVASERYLLARKIVSCSVLALSLDATKRLGHQYVREVAREWAGMRRDHDDAWWARELGMSERRLRQIKRGRSERGQPGLMTELDRIYDTALSQLTEAMVDRKIVTET
jgi:hypothetical protein